MGRMNCRLLKTIGLQGLVTRKGRNLSDPGSPMIGTAAIQALGGRSSQCALAKETTAS